MLKDDESYKSSWCRALDFYNRSVASQPTNLVSLAGGMIDGYGFTFLYRTGVKEKVLDANTIESGKHSGKVMTADGEKVARNDPRLTIEHNKPVVEHWNEQGYNSTRAQKNDFYNDTDNMSLRFRSANSSDGAKMGANGVRYRQDVGPDYN